MNLTLKLVWKWMQLAGMVMLVLGCSTKTDHPQNGQGDGLAIGDTQFLFRSPPGKPYHAIFIDTSSQSTFRAQLMGIKMDEKKVERLDCVGNKFYTSLEGDWLPLFRFNENYYLYSPSDFGNAGKFWISDSSVAFSQMDGVYDFPFHSVKAFSVGVYDFSVHSPFSTAEKLSNFKMQRIHHWKGIYLMEKDFWGNMPSHQYCTRVENAHLFDVIVNYSPSRKTLEYEFEEPIWEWNFQKGVNLTAKRRYSTTDCQASNFAQFKQPKVQQQFFHLVDSFMKVHPLKINPEDCPPPNLTSHWLNHFLKVLDLEQFSQTNDFIYYFDFNQACPGFRDSPDCKDRISVSFFPEDCVFRLVIENSFQVVGDCIGGSQTSYGFGLQQGRIVDFWRQAAG